ncbi:MAG TPA: sulfur carrier protein ThiS [Microbacterium sp.]|nr:sulfur carrier protein ThiS [Microbacterium sp.]
MELDVNGATMALDPDATIADLVTALTGRALDLRGGARDGAPLGIAVAVGASVVPRARWSGHRLSPGDRVEVLTAAQGG